MAKAVLLDVLKSTIGKYVKNLDADNLNLAVWGGNVELHDLTLNVEAVNAELDQQAKDAPHLAVPIRVVSGTFGGVTLKIPWSKLASKPVEVKARGLHVEVEPYDRLAQADFLYSVAESEQKRNEGLVEARMAQIQLADETREQRKKLASLAQEEIKGSDDSNSSSFVSRLVVRIVENLQIEIDRVHFSLKGSEYSAGIVLDGLSFVTTNKDGKKVFIDRTSGAKDSASSFLFKAMKIDGFGIFLDGDSVRKHNGQDHSYIMTPLSFQASVRQADSNVCTEYPKFLVKSELSSLDIGLSRSQLELALKLAKALAPSKNIATPLFPEYRPMQRISKESAGEWWRYAKRCVGRITGRRSWVEFFLAFKKRKRYISLYQRATHCEYHDQLKPLSSAEKLELTVIEKDRSTPVSALMLWRSLADAEIEKLDEKMRQKVSTSIMTSLFGTSSKDEAPIALTIEEKKQMEDAAIEINSFADVSEDSKLLDVEFVLGAFNITMSSRDMSPIVQFQMGTIASRFTSAADGSTSLDYTVQSWVITDEITPNSFFPTIFQRKTSENSCFKSATNIEEGSVEHIFTFSYARDKSGDQKLGVISKGFEAVASPLLVKELIEFVALTGESSQLDAETKEMTKYLYEYAEDSAVDAAGAALNEVSLALSEIWKAKTAEKQNWSISIDFHAPVLLIPDSCTNPAANSLLLDFGHFNMKYGQVSDSGEVFTWFKENQDERKTNAMIDAGKLVVTQCTVALAKGGELEDVLLKDFSFSLLFGIEIDPSSSVPRVCAFADVPNTTLTAAPSQLSKTLAIQEAWKNLMEASESEAQLVASSASESRSVATTTKDVSKEPKQDNGGEYLRGGKSTRSNLLTTLYFQFKANLFRLVLNNEGKAELLSDVVPIGETVSKKSEALVFQGACTVTVALLSDQDSGQVENTKLTLKGDQMQIYSGFGPELLKPTQVLEPAPFVLTVSANTKKVDEVAVVVSLESFSLFDISLSIRDCQLLNEIVEDFTKHMATSKKPTTTAGPTTDDLIHIEHLQEALDPELEIEVLEEGHIQVRQPAIDKEESSSQKAKKLLIRLNWVIPETKITIINDLEGLEEAIIQLSIKDVKALCDIKSEGQDCIEFDIKGGTSLSSKYYDHSVNRWKNLLDDPWKMSLDASRKPDGSKNRYRTRVSVESSPCRLAFSEQFVSSIGSIELLLAGGEANNDMDILDLEQSSERPELHHRNMVKVNPYAIQNDCGVDIEFTLPGENERLECPVESILYFRFSALQGNGVGGKRLFGQELPLKRSLKLYVGAIEICVEDLDSEIGGNTRVHALPGKGLIQPSVKKVGMNVTVLYVSSFVVLHNRTPFQIGIQLSEEDEKTDIGICKAHTPSNASKFPISHILDKVAPLPSPAKGIPIDALGSFIQSWEADGKVKMSLVISPHCTGDRDYQGLININADICELPKTKNKTAAQKFDVVCQQNSRIGPAFVLQVSSQVQLVDGSKPSVSIFLEPRAQLVNAIPLAIRVFSDLPFTKSKTMKVKETYESVHEVMPGSRLEFYGEGPSASLNLVPFDDPVGETRLRLMDSKISLPLETRQEPVDPFKCIWPFENGTGSTGGHELIIANSISSLGQAFLDQEGNEAEDSSSLRHSTVWTGNREFFATVFNYAVDHTGDVLFQMISKQSVLAPVGKPKGSPLSPTFMLPSKQRRVTLLPGSDAKLRLVSSGERWQKGTVTSIPFSVKDVSICKGGAHATPLLWSNKSFADFYAYRNLTEHGSVIHIVPEFVLFNGCLNQNVIVKQKQGADLHVDPGKIAPIAVVSREKGLILSVEVVDVGSTSEMRLDELGFHVAKLFNRSGKIVGSLAVETAIGGADSRLVVKVGGVVQGGKLSSPARASVGDAIDVQTKFSEFRVTLHDSSMDREMFERLPMVGSQQAVCTLRINEISFAYNRNFETDAQSKSAETSRISMVVKRLQVIDETAGSSYPMVVDASTKSPFVDFQLLVNGPITGDFVSIRKLSLNLAYGDGSADSISVGTSEEFAWTLLDLLETTLVASRKGITSDVDPDDKMVFSFDSIDDNGKYNYSPPKLDQLYGIAEVEVSPIKLIVSFLRAPDASRYKVTTGVPGSNLVNYFTQKLKFTIDKARLKFSKFETHNFKGPSSQLVGVLTAFYIAQVKKRALSLLTAASFQDWKNLASRDDGDDDFVDGDILRITGNLAGQSVGTVFKTIGQGLGTGVDKTFATAGKGIENATGLVGAQAVGRGINTVVSGVGSGVGNTLTAAGDGASNVFVGAGKGIGHVVGGVTGGLTILGKGVGKGIVQGDGKAIVSGVTEGVGSVGTGVGNGVKSMFGGVMGGVKALDPRKIAKKK